jgi:hypothetical protein
MAKETVKRKWITFCFRDSVDGPDVVLLGDNCRRVDGGGDSGEWVEYLLFREGVEGPDVVLQVDGDEAKKTVERVWNYLLFRDEVV